WWFLFYSLSPFDDIFTVSFAMAAFYFMEKALREGRRIDFAWAGFWAGAGVMTYISGRLIPVMVAAALGGIFLSLRPAKFLQRYGKFLVLSGLFLLWILGPFILFMAHNPDEFFGRSRELSVFNQVHLTGNVFLPAIYFFWSLVSLFHASPQVDPRFNLPGNCEIDPFTGFLALVGLEVLIVSAFRFKGRFFWYAASGVFFGIVANAFAVQGSTPNPGYTNDQRFFIVLPFMMMVLAAGLDWMGTRLARAPRAFRRAALVLLLLLLGGAAAVNGKVYYWGFQHSPGIWSSLGFNHMKAAEAALGYSPRCHVLVQAMSDSSVFEFLTYGKMPFRQYQGVPIPNQVTKNVAVVFSPWDWSGWGEILQAYPRAIVTDFKDPWNGPAVKVVEIPLADILASQRKMKTLGPALP
ncbi:MAG TPA: hypothetical protein VMU88_04895, partial [bacterium]|nr:hypothetical protein [bacterium]